MSGRQKKYRFALVSHAIEVVNLVRQYSDPAAEELYTTIVGLEDAVATAKGLIRDGYDVILGHGGTGGMIARSIGQPVVNIPTSMLDVITALLEAGQRGRKIAVTSFAAGREGFDIVQDVLGMDVQQIVFNSQAELERGVEKAIQRGVDTIVGGGVSRKIAARLQAEAVIIKPGGQIVKEALAQARALAGVRRRETEHHERLRTIFEIMDDGMLCVDAFCNLKLFNTTAETLLGMALGPRLGRSVSDVAETLGLCEVLASGAKKPDEIIRIKNREVVVTCLPILVDGRVNGAVGLLKEGRAIQNIDRKLRERIHRQGFVARYTMADIVAASARMQNLIARAAEFAQTEAAILISGETGTGKEVLTHALHNASRRRQAPFVAINCAALPENLLESELFGYEEGAFTGAKKGGKIGLFELANHGTIFLDEIGDISSSLQVRLLRVLENKEVMRVGGDRIVPVDVRVISSTHKDLQAEVQAGNFRRDLYYRLAVLRLKIPPLRERLQDIPQLLAPLLKRYRKPASGLTPAMRERIQSYPWAGNIRELNALMESYLILLGTRPSDEGLFDELCEEYAGSDRSAARTPPTGRRREPLSAGPETNVPGPARSLAAHLEDHKRQIIHQTLRACGHNKTLTARRLGISTNTLWRVLKKANERTPDA
jgi:propionate catabolism operon transcriptional regulator